MATFAKRAKRPNVRGLKFHGIRLSFKRDHWATMLVANPWYNPEAKAPFVSPGEQVRATSRAILVAFPKVVTHRRGKTMCYCVPPQWLRDKTKVPRWRK